MLATSLLALAAHPTLPTRWTAVVDESSVGIVLESYLMIDKPSKEAPSAKWTNFTDGSCQRLIYSDGTMPSPGVMTRGTRRFLLGCDAVDCCWEKQSGNHLEYQIPNVHPALLAPVKHPGQEAIDLFNKTTVKADAWAWSALGSFAKYTAYTVGSTLVRWNVEVTAINYTNTYVNYTAVPDSEAAAFDSTFQVPQQCRRPNTLSCGDAGVSPASLAFLRADTFGF